ncbi:MAG: serine/threonine protein kinase, partial [Deltaproteobacteria bacterium]|nr:serine/threonine protein kinase [Deltaproteobacteria bacterium]
MSTLASGSAGADTLSLEDSAPTPLAGPVSGTGPAARKWPTPAAGAPPSSTAKTCPRCQARYPEDFRVCPIDAAELVSSDADADPLLGAVLGGTFQVLRGIGEGGMARVHEARHLRLPKRRFAVKVLHPEYAQQPAIVTRFQREAEAASGIGHPNVVDVFDVGRAPDGRPFLASELLDGSDFSAVLDERGRVPVPYAVHVARQVCHALGAAHELGIVHRDVKPENVFLVGGGERPFVKVLDFGISKIDDGGGGASLTRTGVVMGTPGYMAPEQARGAKVDHRVDVYGVGAMLYRALTGQLPFDGDDAAEVIARVLTDHPRRPRDLAPEIPGALELVVQRAMEKNPADRHASMAELDDALAAFDADA